MGEINIIDGIFDTLTDLTDRQRLLIKRRYRVLITKYRQRCILYSVLFHVFRLTMTVGSLAVPALLTIQNTPDVSNVVYWFTWAVSLAVTTSNGIMLLFKLDKRFFMMHTVIERLRSETWQYVELSGRYSGHHPPSVPPTHANQFVYYCTQIERINVKWVDEEYVKTGEEKVNSPPTQSTAVTNIRDALVPSPPEQKESTNQVISGIVLGEQDESEAHTKDTKNTNKSPVSVSPRQETVSQPIVGGDIILSITPEMPRKPDDGIRAAI